MDPEIHFAKFKECTLHTFYKIKKSPFGSCSKSKRQLDLPMLMEYDHASDKKTRMTRTGLYMNAMVINWFTKKQSNVETSVIGVDFCNMKQGINARKGKRYK